MVGESSTNESNKDVLRHRERAGALLDAATEVHYPQTLFVDPGTFPSERYTSLPLDSAAKHFYKNGASPLRKYLPYRLATLVDWLLVVVLPVAGVAFALLKVVP